MCKNTSGFTLIELSIVLVIIGLIIGGVLVGQDLIAAAAVRAQVTQIEKYRTAVNTFRGKYDDQLPGDISDPDATRFGFSAIAPRGTYGGEGDGNGLIQNGVANNYSFGTTCTTAYCGAPGYWGESATFWVDLSTAGMMDGTFNVHNTQTIGTNGGTINLTSTPNNVASYYPQAKIGGGNFIYVWNGAPPASSGAYGSMTAGQNYFGLSAVTWISYQTIDSCAGLTVAQANAIDTKMDDGLPQSGSVVAVYSSWSGGNTLIVWAASASKCLANNGYPYTPNGSLSVISPTQYTCFDFQGNSSNTAKYTMGYQSGTNVNCALSFAFQ